jgi:type I restriction enzyme, S subunit
MISIEVKFRKTGIDWLEEIPEHWKVVRLKNIVEINARKLSEQTSKNALINYIDITNVNGDGDVLEVQKIKFKDAPSRARRVLRKNDTIISTVRTYLKAITAIREDDFVGSTGFAVLTPDADKLNPDYLYYYVSSKVFVNKVMVNSVGVAYPAITPTTLARLPFILPPIEEQNFIVNILNSESAKITRFIQTKQRFIELLKEQRQSIITQAVTKGIDDSVKMKESVIGEIPEHWEVRRLKFLADVRFSTVDKHSHKEEKHVRLCNYVDVYKHEYITNDFDFMIATATDAEIKRFTVEKGDVIITKDSETANDIAVPALVVEALENVVCAYHLAHIKPNRELIESEFLFRLFQSKKINSHFEVAAKGVTRHGLSYDDINSVFLPYPTTLDEQKKIIKHIKTETRTLDIAISKAEREIELIKEYREAMIAEAVSGKIKL